MLSRRQKNKLRHLLLITLAVVVLITAAWLFWQWKHYRKAANIHYKEFGIIIPGGYEIHGIDVSKYQSSIAWDEVKSMRVQDIQLGFAFIKATEGIGNTDPYFKRNWKKSKDAGIFRGAYHILITTKDGR